LRPPFCNDPRRLAAYRMADEYIAIEAECMCNGRGVVSHGAKIVSPICRHGGAPTTLIERDRARPATESVDHGLPSA
jgi:hypothetical protein